MDPKEILTRLQEILWPDGDTEHQWDSDTLGEIGNLMIDNGYCPDELREDAS